MLVDSEVLRLGLVRGVITRATMRRAVLVVLNAEVDLVDGRFLLIGINLFLQIQGVFKYGALETWQKLQRRE